MVKYLLFAALAGSASAFTPASVANTKTSVSAFADGMVGSEGPEPMPFSTGGTSKEFDPLGFATVRTRTCLTRLSIFCDMSSHTPVVPDFLSVLRNGFPGSVRPN